MPNVRDIMSNKVVSVLPYTPITEVAHQMKVYDTPIVAVCDDQGFCGIVHERDIITGVVAAAADPVTQPAGIIMQSNCPIISPRADIWQAARAMIDKIIQFLPVVEKRRFVGVLTLDDLTEKRPELGAMVFGEIVRLRRLKKIGG